MRSAVFVFCVRLAMAFSLLVPATTATAGQSQSGAGDTDGRWSPPRTAWGAPDLRGVWDYRTMTPLQRPREFVGQAVMTDEEAAAYQARTLEEQADYDRSPSVHAKWWLDYGKELTADKRTSLIVDPPDGPSEAGARARSRWREDEPQRARGRPLAPSADDNTLPTRLSTAVWASAVSRSARHGCRAPTTTTICSCRHRTTWSFTPR